MTGSTVCLPGMFISGILASLVEARVSTEGNTAWKERKLQTDLLLLVTIAMILLLRVKD